MPISFDTIRAGKQYFLRNYGEESKFEVLDIMANGDFKVKDLMTLEVFLLSDLVRYGKGDDYELQEVSEFT